MQAPETREIDGHTWTVSKFTGRESWALFRQLTALSAGPVADAVEGLTSKIDLKVDSEVTLSEILKISGGAVGLAGKIAAGMSDAEFEALSLRLLKFTQVDKRPIAFDADFQGAIPTLIKVLAFVIEVNFIGPFSAWLGPVVSMALGRVTEMVTSTPQPSSETKPNS